MHHGKFLTLKKVMNFPDFLAKFLKFLTIPDIPDIPEKMTTWCLKGNPFKNFLRNKVSLSCFCQIIYFCFNLEFR